MEFPVPVPALVYDVIFVSVFKRVSCVHNAIFFRRRHDRAVWIFDVSYEYVAF